MATNFRIPYVFVAKTGNTLPTAGTASSALTVDQLGVYTGSNQVAVDATAAVSAQYLQIFQGTSGIVPGPNKRSDKILKSNILEFYKVPAGGAAQNQITTISGLLVHEGEETTVAFRLHSRFIDNAFANGMLKSILVQAPCLNCGDDPCAELTSGQYDVYYQAIADKINAHVELKKYLSAVKSGTGSASVVTITGVPLANLFPNNANDPYQNPFFFDKLTFNTYVGKMPTVSQDFVWVDNRCDLPFNTATAGYGVNTTQRSTYQFGTAAMVRKDIIDNYSYQVPTYKELFNDADFNPYLRLSLVDATTYDQYVIKYFTEETAKNDQHIRLVEASYIYVPAGSGTTLEAILVANFGAITSKASTGAVTFTPLTP